MTPIIRGPRGEHRRTLGEFDHEDVICYATAY
jgi:hypothetical protein